MARVSDTPEARAAIMRGARRVSSRVPRHDGAGLQVGLMSFEHFRHECATPLGWNVRQAHKPSVTTTLDEDHVTEVGVDCDEHTPLPLSALEKRPIGEPPVPVTPHGPAPFIASTNARSVSVPRAAS